jgi:hypothetical protein
MPDRIGRVSKLKRVAHIGKVSGDQNCDGVMAGKVIGVIDGTSPSLTP